MSRKTIYRFGLAVCVSVPSLLFAHAASSSLAGSTRANGSVLHSRIAQGGSLTAADVQRLAQNANQRVVVVLRNQHPEVPNGVANAANRQAVVAGDQAPILSELAQIGAPRVRSYHLINAVSATVSSAEAARLAANPLVSAVLPDGVIRLPTIPSPGAAAPSPNSVLPPCTFHAELDPQALQLTNTAFEDSAVPQAQNIATGKGVTVAFIADGLDPQNPDFIRPDGTPVFTDYQDFSGDGPNAPTDSREAFGDASSIAAQGNETYNVNGFVNTAHKQPVACPQIKVLGMAPGASLMGLKAFGLFNISFNSNFVQAIQYAVDHGANVINESFGGNPFPDRANDPITLADDAAVAAGVTVVVSTGDSGTEATMGSPSSDPNVISVGASTQFRVYAQTADGGFQLGNGGYLNNNISSLSSSGPAQSIRQTVDVVAPGDLGWALCSANTAIYLGCTDYNGNPSAFQVFGGTSESSPLTAGEAALVIQAYRDAHGGASPSPMLVKQFITGTATDLGVPTNEQGSGLIDSYRAVQAARSYHDANGSPTLRGSALLASPTLLSATNLPGSLQSFSVQVTNVGARAQTVHPSVRRLAAPFFDAPFTVQLDPATDPTFVDAVGSTRAYVSQQIIVPAGAQRLDAAIAWDVVSQPTSSPVRLTLFDPQGRFAAFSIPQDPGAPFSNSGYGHVDVRFPRPGAWRAVIWTRATASGYHGPVHLDVSTSRFENAGAVSPPARVLRPGESATFTVKIATPPQPGDQSLGVYFNGATGNSAGADVSNAGDTTVIDNGSSADSANTTVIPVVLRSLVPLSATGGSFSGVLTGGNGRQGSPGQTFTYGFDVPAGLHDLDLGLSIADNNTNLEGVLVTPDGRPIDVQSTVTSTDLFGLPASYTNTLQFFRRDPEPGRWQFVLLINNNISGAQTALPFTASIQLNAVKVGSSGVPNDPNVILPAGVTANATISVTNTGNTTKDFFVDPRLASTAPLFLGALVLPLPVPGVPSFFVPPESSDTSIVAESVAPSVPVNMDIAPLSGAPPYGGTGSPDIEATTFVDPFTGNYAAVASSHAAEVAPGPWGAFPTEVGPYPNDGAASSNVELGAVAITQQFDLAADSSTGDAWAILAGEPSSGYAPLTLAPGATGAINVTITPTASPGTVVTGFLYVDTLNANSANVGLITGVGDELVAIPYSYTVGDPPATATSTPTSTDTPTNTATSTSTSTSTATATPTAISGSGTLTGSGAVPAGPINLTSQGTLDWAHWGQTSTSSFEHKAAVTQQISNFSLPNGGATGHYAVYPSGYTWSDGTPVATATSSYGVYTTGQGHAFQITVPADNLAARTLRLYVGQYQVAARLTATLSDGSALPYSETFDSHLGASARYYTINYRAGIPGQTLTVVYTLLTDNATGNIQLHAATLS